MGRTPLLLASLLAESERALSASRMVADAILHPGKCPGVRVLCPESGSTPDGQLDQSQAASNVVLVSVEPAGNRTRTASPPLITCTDGPGPSSSSSESTTNGRAEEKGRMRTIGCGHLDTYWWACLRTAMGVVAVVHVCCGEHADENAAPPPRRQQRNTGSIRVKWGPQVRLPGIAAAGDRLQDAADMPMAAFIQGSANKRSFNPNPTDKNEYCNICSWPCKFTDASNME